MTNSCFTFGRLLKNELIVLATGTKHKLYLSKEIVWSRLAAFYLPKASPFEVRIRAYTGCLFRCVINHNNVASFQRDLNIAIAWWVDTGIYFKMEADIKSEYGSQRDSWTMPKVRGKQSLGFSHILPSFIIFGVATFLSMVAFSLEIFPYLYKQHVQRRRAGRMRRMWRQRMQRRPRRSKAAPNRPMAAPNMPNKD